MSTHFCPVPAGSINNHLHEQWNYCHTRDSSSGNANVSKEPLLTSRSLCWDPLARERPRLIECWPINFAGAGRGAEVKTTHPWHSITGGGTHRIGHTDHQWAVKGSRWRGNWDGNILWLAGQYLLFFGVGGVAIIYSEIDRNMKYASRVQVLEFVMACNTWENCLFVSFQPPLQKRAPPAVKSLHLHLVTSQIMLQIHPVKMTPWHSTLQRQIRLPTPAFPPCTYYIFVHICGPEI